MCNRDCVVIPVLELSWDGFCLLIHIVFVCRNIGDVPPTLKGSIVSRWANRCRKKFCLVLQTSWAVQYYPAASCKKCKISSYNSNPVLTSFTYLFLLVIVMSKLVIVMSKCWDTNDVLYIWQPAFIQRSLLYKIQARRKKRFGPWINNNVL
jgi:hypothetical protein